MSRFTPIAPETATGKAKELLDAVKSKLGLAPNEAPPFSALSKSNCKVNDMAPTEYSV
jgi:hypothetical protein